MAPPAGANFILEGSVSEKISSSLSITQTNNDNSPTTMTRTGPNSMIQRVVCTTKKQDDGMYDPDAVPASATTISSEIKENSNLRLLFLGCEAKGPYGPYNHTADLFLDLIEAAINKQQQSKTGNKSKEVLITLNIYHVSEGNFPTYVELEDCDGVILPGSFNSAYDEEPWIVELKSLIQTKLVPKKIKTLGVCFGHQIYAHSFQPYGSAIKCPAGPQAGRKTSQLTEAGQQFLMTKTSSNRSNLSCSETLDLYYTHGDMVEKLPPQGNALGGNENVPIQAAIYHSMETSPDNSTREVIAVTFQAHPEYGTSKEKGLEKTLQAIIDAMKARGDITVEEQEGTRKDTIVQFERVQEQSIDAMIAAGQLLGWFP